MNCTKLSAPFAFTVVSESANNALCFRVQFLLWNIYNFIIIIVLIVFVAAVVNVTTM